MSAPVLIAPTYEAQLMCALPIPEDVVLPPRPQAVAAPDGVPEQALLDWEDLTYAG